MEENVMVLNPEASLVKNSSQENTRVAAPEKSPNESEYDSAGSYSDTEGERGRREDDSGSEGSVGIERESGDGQESLPNKKVDDDEDKKNPQYIPKRGTFYEHDDRTVDDEEVVETAEPEKEKDQKKKVWQEKKERWSHDRFDDSEQAPKSRAELVSIYGYDIRNEEGPPRARRRRRYGRGPNKYTRNWKDEDAYSKPPITRAAAKPFPKKGVNSREEFPSLNEADDIKPEEDEPKENGSEVHDSGPVEPPMEPTRSQPRVGSGRVVKPKREIKDSDYRGFTTKSRQGRNMKTEQKVTQKPPRKDDFIATQNFTNKSNQIPDLDKELAKLSVQDGPQKGKHGGGTRQGGVPPRLQSEQKVSKRYSSQRQRSLPEAGTPPFNQHTNYYPNEFNQGNQVGHRQPNQHHTTTPQVSQIAPPPLPPISQVPVTATPILQPPQFAPPFPQAPPPFLQPAPPPFIPQQQPQIINYVPSQPQFAQGFQGYQQQFNAVSQPELYQSQTGITYYSTDQQLSQRAAPLRRPKAAIPIVAPPPLDLKGKVKEDDLSAYEGDISEDQSVDGQVQDTNIL